MVFPAYVPLRSTDTPTAADVAALDRLCGAIDAQAAPVRPSAGYQPYFVAYAHSHGFADPGDVKARDTTGTGRFQGRLFMAWIQGQWSEWAAEDGVREIRASVHGPAFGAWLAARCPTPVGASVQD